MCKWIKYAFFIIIVMSCGSLSHGVINPTKEQLKKGHRKFVGHPRQSLAIVADAESSELLSSGRQQALTLSLVPLLKAKHVPVLVSMSVFYNYIQQATESGQAEGVEKLLGHWNTYHVEKNQFIFLLAKDRESELSKYFKIDQFKKIEITLDENKEFSGFEKYGKNYINDFFKNHFKVDVEALILSFKGTSDIKSDLKKAFEYTNSYDRYLSGNGSIHEKEGDDSFKKIRKGLKKFFDKYGKTSMVGEFFDDALEHLEEKEKKVEEKEKKGENLAKKGYEIFYSFYKHELEQEEVNEEFPFESFPRIKTSHLNDVFSEQAYFSPEKKDSPLWIISWDGHGMTDDEENFIRPSFGGLYVRDMQDVLEFFNQNAPGKVRAETFFLITCYSGGRNVDLLKNYKNFIRTLNYLLVVQGITDEVVYGLGDKIIDFFKDAEKGLPIESILYKIFVEQGSEYRGFDVYQHILQVLYPGTSNFLPITLSKYVKSIGKVLLRTHQEEQKAINLSDPGYLVSLIYPSIVDVPVHVNLFNTKDLEHYFSNPDNFTSMLNFVVHGIGSTYSFLLDIGEKMFGFKRYGDLFDIAGQGKELTGNFKKEFDREFPALFGKGLYYDILKLKKSDFKGDVRFPWFIPMKRGKDIIQFFSEIQLSSETKVKEKREKFLFAGILQFLRDAFFDVSEWFRAKRTFLIDKLEGANDISLFLETQRAKSFEKNRTDLENLENSLRKNVGERIILEKVKVEVSVEEKKEKVKEDKDEAVIEEAIEGEEKKEHGCCPDLSLIFIKNVEFIFNKKAWKLTKKEWKRKSGEHSPFGLKWEFVKTDLDEYTRNYKESLKKVLKQEGKTESVDTFLENVHKKKKGKLVSFLKEQEKGFPRFIKSLISSTETLVSKLNQKEKGKIASELAKLAELKNKSSDQFTIDDKVTLNIIQRKIAEAKEEIAQKKDPVIEKVNGVVSSLDDLKKSLSGLSSTLEAIAGTLVTP